MNTNSTKNASGARRKRHEIQKRYSKERRTRILVVLLVAPFLFGVLSLLSMPIAMLFDHVLTFVPKRTAWIIVAVAQITIAGGGTVAAVKHMWPKADFAD